MPAPSLVRYRDFESRISDAVALSKYVRDVVELNSPRGISIVDMHRLVVKWAVGDDDDYFIRSSALEEPVSQALARLQDNKFIGYNQQGQVWYYRGSRELTPEAAAFLRSRGFGSGWKTISDPRLVIDWMVQNLSPMQFERFCISLLKNHLKLKVDGTRKDPISGADGGIDGFREIEVDGVLHPAAIEVKAYATYRKVGYLPIERLGGKMARHGWKMGIFITSGTFNEEAEKCLNDFCKQGYIIYTADQDRFLNIMLDPMDKKHGFGLYKSNYVSKYTDAERVAYYINEGDIFRASN